MNLQARIDLMQQLGHYLLSTNADWQSLKQNAYLQNAWFIPAFVDNACVSIADNFLQKPVLQSWASHYFIGDSIESKNIGIVMAGNIPLVGFHDFLGAFICGHRQTIKPSGKDDILLRHLVQKLIEWEPSSTPYFSFAENLKGCDAYIATGSNNSARYFEQYFSKYPHIIRRNRTSVAFLNGTESTEALNQLSDDIHLYFGLGCRNVSKLYVPAGYNFVPLLQSFNKYLYFADHNKYKNNYDYQLSLVLLNNIFYMTNGSTLLTQNNALFSPISHVYFEYYDKNQAAIIKNLHADELQCVLGLHSSTQEQIQHSLPNSSQPSSFGQAQTPGLMDYADGVDTMQFLLSL